MNLSIFVFALGFHFTLCDYVIVAKNYTCIPPDGSFWRVGCVGASAPYGMMNIVFSNETGAYLFNPQFTLYPQNTARLMVYDMISGAVRN